MANEILKYNMSVLFIEEDVNKTTRYMDESIQHIPLSHTKGKATIPGNTTDFELATNVNFVSLVSSANISIKVGDTTAPVFNNMRMFSYDGSPTTLFITNSSVDSIVIEYSTGKF